jgi:DNA-binding beta-propeller fold protein YncE
MIRLTTHTFLIVLLYGTLNFNCNSQVINNTAEKEKLTLISKIILPKVSGRIDHIAYDSANHLAFIAALGNNTVEVVNINSKQVVHTITGLHEPQGIIYISSIKKLVVANGGNGDCVFFDATTYTQPGIVHFKNDADNIRYDAVSHLLYIGYGNGDIAVIDANAMKLVYDIALDGHPESFQISRKQNHIYINVPDANEIEVAELSIKKIIAKWKNTGASSNFPMALDEENNHLFIGCRSPATLRMISTETGKDLSDVSCSGDADDVFYNASDSLVFVSADKGFIDVFRTNEKKLTQINHIKTSSGARTSLLLASEKKFLLAVPAHAGNPAALWIYNIN